MSDNDKYKVLDYVENTLNNIQQMGKYFDMDDKIEAVEEFINNLREMILNTIEDFDTGDWY